MDDWVILAPTRWALRRAVRLVNQTLAELKVEQHPDKTFIGRVEKGFTFLGYRIATAGVIGVAPSCWEGFQERVLRLYEQNAPTARTRNQLHRPQAGSQRQRRTWSPTRCRIVAQVAPEAGASVENPASDGGDQIP